MASVHTHAQMLSISLWLASTAEHDHGSVTTDEPSLSDPVVRMRTELGNDGRVPVTIRPGSGREMARSLKPGHALMVLPDVDRGRTVIGTWRGGRMRVATGAFRLARASRATVVPMIAVDTGRWRWRIVIGQPIPADLIAGRRYVEAAGWFADQVLPTIAQPPEPGAPRPVLPAAIQPGGDSSRTGSATTGVPLTH